MAIGVMPVRVATDRRWVKAATAVLLVLGVIAASCGDDDSAPATTTSTLEDVTVSTSPTTDDTTTTSTATTATTDATTTETAIGSTTTDTTTATTSTLPGTDFGLAPPAGRTLAVMGVRHDDVLHVRLLPGTDQPIVADLAPTADDPVATGRARSLTRSIWFEVTTADGTTGWVSSSFVAHLGPTFDATSQVVADLGEIPTAETMTDLGELVADVLGPNDPEYLLRVTLTVAPTVGDLGEVTYDVVGTGDDALAGIRLHVFGQPDESGDAFSLKSVEATELCVAVRGSVDDGPCA